MNKYFNSAVIVSAGNSTRMGGVNKQFLEILSKPVIAYTVSAFENCKSIDEIVIVTRKCDIDSVKKICKDYSFTKVTAVVEGGETRQLSVLNGVKNTSQNTDFVLIHDGARPLISEKVIEDTLSVALIYGAAATGVKVKDTVKQVDCNDRIVDTPDRNCLRFIQTPQIFKKSLYLTAVETVENSRDFTDDCKLIEAMGKTVRFVEGDYENIKITTPDDIAIAETYLKRKGK